VLGVSEQDAASHTSFVDKYHLPLQLLPDETGALTTAYHVPVTLGLAKRVTYLIDKDGTIKRVWPAVTPARHAVEILAALSGSGL
jgi:peroxiredoxin Q/BCP